MLVLLSVTAYRSATLPPLPSVTLGDEIEILGSLSETPPATLWFESFVIAIPSRLRSASMFRKFRIVPPFAVSASVSMLMPSASRSEYSTV